MGKKGIENNFSNNLINLRRNVGLTRKQLAEELGVSSRLISELESGKIFPSMASVKKISEYFDVSGEFLLGLPESNELNAFEIMTLQDFIDYSSPRQREVFDEILFAIAQANKISVNEELLIKMRDILFILSDLPLNTDDLEDHRTMRLMD
ncbi:helix-turn-helix transcriptional regulator [Lactococcus lactis]|uniref:helix-turn-helix transcriptional regulator n=1 Tax=Lactococcus lactis TaxID=1358 RepID=UPI00207C513E|nr:helix-turn-helix transcriptional regulator [Lactococcus lactis]MCO0815519.1 helix-turn-helix domain-containing protein [Lactococcus lactis]